jgi:hypothetical protein
MPPKKDKKKKASRKKIKMAMPEIPRFATGFNRQIPGGVFASGGGGGGIPASFIGAGYASRQPPPATPIQTPDSFNIIQQQQKLASSIAEVQEEQKVARKERSDKGQKRGPRTPLETMTMTEQIQQETPAMSSMPNVDVPETPEPNITKVKKPKTKKQEVMVQPPATSFASPAVISSPDFPGGVPMNQQGMFMGTPAKLKGSPYDPTSDLDGVPDPIGEPTVFLG